MNSRIGRSISSASALAVIAATSIVTIPAAEARGTYAQHTQLGNAIRSTGVVLKFNPLSCNKKDAMGWYWGHRNEMVICQQNRYLYRPIEVRWTEEDLDTLRHEAQHLIQDCMDGHRNGLLGSVYKDPVKLAKGTLTKRHIQLIIESYREQGASNHVIVMELEAFSVAALNIPAEQTRDIQRFCF